MKQTFTFFKLLPLLMPAILLLALANNSMGQISISAGNTITQALEIGTSATASLPTNWKVDKISTVRTVGTYATAVTATQIAGGVNIGTAAENGIYNFYSGTTASGTERAVGWLSSSSATKSGNLYAYLKNTGTSTINDLTISYNVEKYRNGSNSAGFTVQMYYSTNGTSWTSAGANFTTSFGSDANNIGFANPPGSSTAVTNQTLSQSMAADAVLYLAWNYSVTSGTTTSNAQALGIDDVSITANGAASPSVTLSSPNQVANGNIAPGATNAFLSVFQAAVAGGSDQTLNQLDFTTAGTYAATDMTNFKLWYSSSNWASAVLIKTLSSALGIGSHSFTGLSQLITNGNTGYFWITCDVPSTATTGKTINVAANPTFTFASAITPTGSIAAGGTQTIQNASSASDHFRSYQTGNWGDVSTWQSSPTGSDPWISATHTPTDAANTITILNGHTVTVAASVTADQLTVNTGGKIVIAASQTLTIVNGADATDLSVLGTVENSGTLTLTGAAVFGDGSKFVWAKNGGAFNNTNVTWGTGSTVEITGCTGASPTNLSQPFYNFTWNCTGQTVWLNLALTGSFSCSGDLTIKSTGGGAVGLNMVTSVMLIIN
mgnify:CR=1 FL=1